MHIHHPSSMADQLFAVAAAHELMASNATTTTTVRDDSDVVPKSVLTIDSSPGNELRFVLHVAQDVIDEFLPALLWLTLILAVTAAVTYALVRCCGLLTRQCGWPENWARMSHYLLAGLLLFFGFTLAFGAVGVNFGQLFFGLSLVTAGAIVSTSDDIKNLAVGAKLASQNLLTKHHMIEAPAIGVQGEIIAMGAFMSEIRPITTDAATATTNYADKTIFVDNRLLLTGPLIVQWHDVRSSERQARFTAAAAAMHKQQQWTPPVQSTRFDDAERGQPMSANDLAKAAARKRMLSMAHQEQTLQRRMPATFNF